MVIFHNDVTLPEGIDSTDEIPKISAHRFPPLLPLPRKRQEERSNQMPRKETQDPSKPGV